MRDTIAEPWPSDTPDQNGHSHNDERSLRERIVPPKQ
jgi:hypothetical protein